MGGVSLVGSRTCRLERSGCSSRGWSRLAEGDSREEKVERKTNDKSWGA